MSGLVVVHLYPRELGINGDVGNVMALRQRAEWRGVKVEVVDVGPGEELPSEAHLVHVGSGPASARQTLHADIARHAEHLRKWADNGVPFLGIAAGWQLLGSSVTELEGSVSTGAGVFPSSAIASSTRVVGEVAGTSEVGEVAGFVNYGATSTVDAGVASLADLGTRGHDGLVAGALVATNLHGPFLPMNPAWADHLLDLAGRLAGIEWGDADPRVAVQDERARRSRDAIRARLG